MKEQSILPTRERLRLRCADCHFPRSGGAGGTWEGECGRVCGATWTTIRRPCCDEIQVPVLLVLGEEDRPTPARETAVRVERAIAEGHAPLTIRLVPGADYALMVRPSADAAWLAARPA
jgi:hypothetical protein